MITIINKESSIKVNIDLSIEGWSIECSYMRCSPMDAKLLADQINRDLDSRIAQIKKEAYELG
jgi:hypothetical protein